MSVPSIEASTRAKPAVKAFADRHLPSRIMSDRRVGVRCLLPARERVAHQVVAIEYVFAKRERERAVAGAAVEAIGERLLVREDFDLAARRSREQRARRGA